MGSFDDLLRDLRTFDGRREVTRQLRAEIRRPLPAVRAAIRRRALDTLPAGGGLNAWVAGAKVTAVVRLAGRAAGIRLRGGRRSTGAKTDLRRLDIGKVRAPSWGRRGDGDWHLQTVEPAFFTAPAGEYDQWRAAAVRAVDQAAEVIRRG